MSSPSPVQHYKVGRWGNKAFPGNKEKWLYRCNCGYISDEEEVDTHVKYFRGAPEPSSADVIKNPPPKTVAAPE